MRKMAIPRHRSDFRKILILRYYRALVLAAPIRATVGLRKIYLNCETFETPSRFCCLNVSAVGATRQVLMKNALADDHSHERYVVEVDGVVKCEYRVFVKALTAGLQLKQEFPNSSIKLRDAEENTSIH
jgi:hypothetical protein